MKRKNEVKMMVKNISKDDLEDILWEYEDLFGVKPSAYDLLTKHLKEIEIPEWGFFPSERWDDTGTLHFLWSLSETLKEASYEMDELIYTEVINEIFPEWYKTHQPAQLFTLKDYVTARNNPPESNVFYQIYKSKQGPWFEQVERGVAMYHAESCNTFEEFKEYFPDSYDSACEYGFLDDLKEYFK